MYESCDYEEIQGEIELLEEELMVEESMAKCKIKKAQIKKKQFQLLDMKRQAQDRVREVKQWEIIKQEEIKKDNTFDTKNPNTHQFESYTLRYQKELQISKDTGNADLYKSVASSLDTMKSKLKELE